MKRLSASWIYLLFLAALTYPLVRTFRSYHHSLPVLALLVPGGSENSITTQIWMKAAEEEGIPLERLTDEALLDPFQIGSKPKAIIVPDDIARDASSTVVSYLQNYVNQGGRLVLVGDALMHDLNGRLKESFPAETYFGFPTLLGRQGDTLQLARDTIRITDEWKQKLRIPPGQYSPADSKQACPFRELCTYQSLHSIYPHWKTDHTAYGGTRILEAGDGSLIAGLHPLEQGEVLWINLPLSFLKKRTDGLLMHSFLRWISEDWLGLPRLVSVPNGQGGIVLNVHVDSNAAIPYLTRLKDEGFFADGPFSIHVTAGPDTRRPHDGLGVNLLKNQKNQEWVRYWLKMGHSVGSHGGWIHDYFGLHVGETSTPEFVGYLEKNYAALKEVMKKPPSEYSAPIGHQPIWVNDWLSKKGYRSYYFVGDSGMGPTQNFRDETFTDEHLWSFPVSSYLQAASFEEAHNQKVSETHFTNWLKALSHYVSTYQSARLFYFHPPGIKFYPNALSDWRKENQKLIQAHRFQWYTMERLSRFLTNRSQIYWTLKPLRGKDTFELAIAGQNNLHEMVWRLPVKTAKNVRIVSGSGRIETLGPEFQIQPTDDKGLKVHYEEIHD